MKIKVIPHDVSILFSLFAKALIPRKRYECPNVKEHYANEHYDWIDYPQFPEKILHDKRREVMALRAGKYIHSKVLDVGCGTGLITQVLKGDVWGLDISEWKLKRAKRHVPTAKFVVGDAEDMPFDGESFDCVVSTDILEHLERPDLAVRGIYRILKQGGVYIGTVPSKHIVWKMRRFLTTSDFGIEPFHNYYSVKQVRDMMESFEVLEITHQCYGLEIFFALRKK